MKFRLVRTDLQPDYTIGRLEVWKDEQWAYLCDTLEEAVRNKNKRGKYPYTDIRLISNGILVTKMSDQLIQTIIDNDILSP